MKKAAPAPPKKSVAPPSSSAPPAQKVQSARPDSSATAKRVGSAAAARPARPPSPATSGASSTADGSSVTRDRRSAAENAWKRLAKRLPELSDSQLWKRIAGEGSVSNGGRSIDFKVDNAHRARISGSILSEGGGTLAVKGSVLQTLEAIFDDADGGGGAVTFLMAPNSEDKLVLRGDQKREWTRSSRSVSGSGSSQVVHAGSVSAGGITVSCSGNGKSSVAYTCDASSVSPFVPSTVSIERSGEVVSVLRLSHASGATSVIDSRKGGSEIVAQMFDNKASFVGGVQWNGEHSSFRLSGSGKLTCGSSSYDGGWKDGLRHGQGTFTICGPTGPTVQYAGPWQHDERHGPDGCVTLYSPMCNVLVTSSWNRGELDGAATIGIAGASNAHVKQQFNAGSLGPNVTLWMETGHFSGQWNDVLAALQFASSQSQSQPSFLKSDTSSVSKTFREVGEAFAAVDAVTAVEHRATERHLTLPASKAMIVEQLGLVGAAVVVLQLESAAEDRALEALSGVMRERDELKSSAAKASEALQKKQLRLDGLNADAAKARSAVEAARGQEEKEAAASRGNGGNDNDADLTMQHKGSLEQKTYLQGALTTAQAQLAHAKAELKTVQTRIAQLVKDSKNGDEEASKLSEKLAALAGQKTGLQQKLSEVEKDTDSTIQKRETARKELQSQLDTLQQTIAAVQAPNTPEEEERRAAAIKSELKEVQARVAALKKSLQSSEHPKQGDAELETKNRSLQTLQAGIDQAKAARAQAKDDVEELTGLSEYLKQSLRQLEHAAEAEKDLHSSVPDQQEELRHSAAVNDAAVQLAEADAAIERMGNENKSKEVMARRLHADLAAALEAQPPAALSPSPPPKQRRSDELEQQVKQLLSKCDQLRRKRDNIEERIASLTKQVQDIANRQQKRAEEEKSGSSYNCRTSGLGDVSGYSTSELKALVQKMRMEMEAAESATAQRKHELERSLEELAAARKRRNDAQHSQPKTIDWKLKVLQDEVDAREARIASLRSDQRRIQLLEARIEAAKEAVRNMTQSSELRQNQAATMARADQEWSHTTTLARAGSIVSRQANVARLSNARSSFSFDN